MRDVQDLGATDANRHEGVGDAAGHRDDGRISRIRGDLSELAGDLALQGSGDEVPPKRRRIRVKTRDPSFGVRPDCWGRVREDGSRDSKDPCKRRRVTVKSRDTLGGMLVASDSRGGVRGSCQGGSKSTRSEEPITRDPGYNDGCHWPG